MAPRFNPNATVNGTATWQQQRSVFVDFSSDGDDGEQDISNGNGPRTAPLNGSFNLKPVPAATPNVNVNASANSRRAYYSSTDSPSPLSRRNRAAHKRTPSFPFPAPSDGMFSSSSSASKSASVSDLSLPAQPHTQPIDLKALFQSAMASSSVSSFSSFGGSSTPASKQQQKTVPATVGPLLGTTKYANSNFQNSPSPEQLPPPSFMFGQSAAGSVGKLVF
jgi:hypothetical protein